VAIRRLSAGIDQLRRDPAGQEPAGKVQLDRDQLDRDLLEKWPCSGVSLAGRHQLGVIDRMSRVIASEATG
jgi:hypothetical protein